MPTDELVSVLPSNQGVGSSNLSGRKAFQDHLDVAYPLPILLVLGWDLSCQKKFGGMDSSHDSSLIV